MARRGGSPVSPLASPVADVSQTQVVGRDLVTVDPATGLAPRTRLKTAKKAHDLFLTLLEADRKSAFNRTVLQEMWDGAPPQKDSVLQQMGMGWVYNLNWLGADKRMTAAVAAYDDLLDSSEHLISPEFVPGKLSPDDQADVSDIVADEHATLLRERTEFYSHWNRLASEFCGHGVGFGYYIDAENPWWEPAGWNQVVIPRKTKVRDDYILVFCTRHEYKVNDLYNKCFGVDKQFRKGWNEVEVKKAIIGAARGQRFIRRWYDHWPEVEAELKNNDIGFGLGDSECVQAVHVCQQEFDGSFSFYVILENGTMGDWLYQDQNRYKSASECFVSFVLNTGNGTFHSIRGALWKMFPKEQALNRFKNKMMTNTDIAMTLLVQGEEGDSYDDMQITLGPAIGYLPPGAKVVERELPEVGTQGMPVIRHLELEAEDSVAQFQASSPAPYQVDQKGNPPTKYQLQMNQASEGSLTTNAVNRFYRSVDVLFNEQFTRFKKIGKTGAPLPSGKCKYPEVKEFFERIQERLDALGLGLQAEKVLTWIRRVRAARAIGNGSPQMRLLALNELQEMAGELDETGRSLAARDRIAARFGRSFADRYKPRVKRIAPDYALAQVENAALKNDSFSALPDQNHAVHVSVHVPKFQQIVQQIVAYREQDPSADFTPMEPNLDWALNLHDHASQHVQGMASDPTRVQDMKSYKAALEQGGNLLAGFARELQQQERHHTEQTGMQIDSKQSQMDAISESDPRLKLEMQKQIEELQQKRETHAVSMQLASAKVAQVAQQMRLNQVKTDAAISQGIRARQTSVPESAVA
jgi:hypothetical protein